MRVFQEPDSDRSRTALTFALGALGGLAVGMILYRRGLPTVPAGSRERLERFGSGLREQASGLRERASGLREQASGLRERASGLRERASGLREQARSVARRIRPERMTRMPMEQTELTALEDRVLDAFLADAVLGERGIDIGAISPGIIELSGSVRTEEEAERAVHAANAVAGVTTVVNRLDVGEERPMSRPADDETEGSEWTGRMVGMNRRRQGRQTDPDTNDDSQAQTIKALRNADLTQLEDDDLGFEQPRVQGRPAAGDPWQVNFDEDELDNQDPHGKHAAYTLDEPQQELNSAVRVGEGLKSGEHLALEKADVPVKPHSGKSKTKGEGAADSAD